MLSVQLKIKLQKPRKEPQKMPHHNQINVKECPINDNQKFDNRKANEQEFRKDHKIKTNHSIRMQIPQTDIL